MSRIGYYLEVTPAELAQLRHEPRQAHAFVHRAEDDLCVERYASDIQILLDRVGLPFDVVRGGVKLCDDCAGGDGVAFFSVEEVRVAAEWFTLVSFDELASGRELEHVRPYFDGLTSLFAAAARNGDAILRWFG